MNQPKIILGIESSCDETAAAVCLKDGNRVEILSNVVASSAALQAKYGGVIPESAAREQQKSIIPVIAEALDEAHLKPQDLDAIAVTYGPGLIGSLLIGVETAKALAIIWNKPLIPVNHLLGHFYANWIANQGNVSSIMHYEKEKKSKPLIHNAHPIPHFPFVGLLVSGGHTDLVLFYSHGKFKYLGGTRDDAAGECFDKCARLLGLPYPGGPNLSGLAEKGDPKTYQLPRPMLNSKDLDFSFSGLKTAVSNLKKSENSQQTADLCASIEDAITDVLIEKTVAAAQINNVDQIVIAGGVAANKILAKKLTQTPSEIIAHAGIYIPPVFLCTDNAAMIAAAAFFNNKTVNPLNLQADPNLSLS